MTGHWTPREIEDGRALRRCPAATAACEVQGQVGEDDHASARRFGMLRALMGLERGLVPGPERAAKHAAAPFALPSQNGRLGLCDVVPRQHLHTFIRQILLFVVVVVPTRERGGVELHPIVPF
jgi:hypothetical protein